MRGTALWALVMVMILAAPALAKPKAKPAPSRLWGLSLVGGQDGDSFDNFYRNGVVGFVETMKAFKVPADRRFVSFGGPKDECYVEFPDDAGVTITRQREAFLAKPSDCSLAVPVFQLMMADRPKISVCTKAPADKIKDLRDADGDRKSDLSGPATRDAFFAKDGPLEKLIKGARKGDHVTWALTDHGVIMEPEWIFVLTEGASLSATELGTQLKRLTDKGVTVHLDVEACFSGGFTRQLTSVAGAAPVCVTAMADANIVGYGEDALIRSTFDGTYPGNLQKYGNQLQAFACSMASDALNRPNTSLDTIVERWEGEQPAGALKDCVAISGLADVVNQFKSFGGAVDQAAAVATERTTLLAAYRDSFAAVAQQCASQRDADVKLAKSLQGCVESKEFPLPDLRDYMRDFLASETGEPYDVKMMNRHLRFLSQANAAKLAEFKAAFCCLAYDMKTGKAPSLCESK